MINRVTVTYSLKKSIWPINNVGFESSPVKSDMKVDISFLLVFQALGQLFMINCAVEMRYF